jgi:hypothetical protein
MSLGEVYYHLLPSGRGPLDSLALVEFMAAAEDAEFSPPRFHLAELAIRSGGTTRAKTAVADFLRLSEDTASADQRAELLLMLDCASKGRRGVEWSQIALIAPLDVLSAAKLLAAGGAYPGCAEDGFRAVFDHASSLGDRWGAFLGLQGVLAAQGRTSELKIAVDTAVRGGLDLATSLYVLDALAGVSLDTEAASIAARMVADPESPSSALWLAGEWYAAHGDSALTKSIRDSLAARGARDSSAGVGPYIGGLDARLILLHGDSTAAIARLRELLALAPQADLDWGLGASLGPSRLLLARLLLARGQPRDALVAAGVFDHPVPIVFLPFLPASLELRRRAAEQLGQAGEARTYAARLAALGATEQLGSAPRSSTPEAP